MSDIEKRLREAHPMSAQYAYGSTILLDAADRIAALEARCAALTAELEECIGNCADPSDKRRIRELEAALRRADDIEHSISAEDWYKERDRLLTASETGTKSAPQWNVCPHCRTEWIASDGAVLPCPICSDKNRGAKP